MMPSPMVEEGQSPAMNLLLLTSVRGVINLSLPFIANLCLEGCATGKSICRLALSLSLYVCSRLRRLGGLVVVSLLLRVCLGDASLSC